MTTIVKAADAAQFLGSIPALLGFTPVRSVVLLPFAGRRTCGGLRLDLPESEPEAAAATMIGLLCRMPETTSVAIVVYAADPSDRAGSAPLPWAGLVDALRVRADACGIAVRDALFVGASGWGSYLDPAPLRPLPEISAPAGIDAPTADQHADAALPDADPERRAAIERLLALLADGALDEARDPAADPEPPAESTAVLEVLADPLALFERCAVDESELTDEEATALTLDLTAPAVKDIALIQWATNVEGGARAYREAERWRRDSAYSEELAGIVYGEGVVPDPRRLRTALTHCLRLAADAPEAHRPRLLTVCAWLAWAQGRGTQASAHASAALRGEPDLVIAAFVQHSASAGILPTWCFAWAGRTTSRAGRGSSRGSRAR